MKLVLAVIDGCKPAMLRQAVDEGRAPVLAAVLERGSLVEELSAAFPSVTPVCATSIATGTLQDRHRIAGMNWWSRTEGRHVEYGSSFRAALKAGFARQLTDTVFNLNSRHLSREVRTIYESLDDAGVRTAGTTFLITRGRHAHQLSRQSPLTRLAATMWRRPLMGPRELFYADLFASRETGCRGRFGMPGIRDQHAGCAAAWLAARDLYDFLLLSLPDNDTHSHRYGPDAQPASIAAADRQLQRVADSVGGVEAFLDTHAVIVCADHSHAPVQRRATLTDAFAPWRTAGAGRASAGDAQIAVCPNQRAAMVYALDDDPRLVGRLAAAAQDVPGVDLVAWREHDRAVLRAPGRGELRFSRSGPLRDARGGQWTVEGDPGVLGAEISDGGIDTPDYPDALRRVWAALRCQTAGDVLLSAGPGWEFPDAGGVDHVGGGSHGSLHRSDSLGALAFCGCDPPPQAGAGAWSITDVAPMVRSAFGVH